MLELISNLQRDKPGRQLGKSVVVLKMKIWREQKEWSKNEGNLNSLEKRLAFLIFEGLFDFVSHSPPPFFWEVLVFFLIIVKEDT